MRYWEMQIRNILALLTTNKLKTKPKCRQSVQHKTNHVDGNYTLRKQMMIINGELESIDRMMSPQHHGDILSTDDR